MVNTFNCPRCNAPLDLSGSKNVIQCPYCGNSVIVPEDLRAQKPPASIEAVIPGSAAITAEQMAEIRRLTQAGEKINAIKLVRQLTSLGLKEAKDFVEAIEAEDPTAPPPVKKNGAKTAAILVGLFFFAIASIFPLVFIPLGIDSWQAHDYVGAILSIFGATFWALIWGGIGWIFMFS
jgi:DNA-directed RNA polymerase subunit RPC12/RpoP